MLNWLTWWLYRRRRIKRAARPLQDLLEDPTLTREERNKICDALGDLMKDDR